MYKAIWMATMIISLAWPDLLPCRLRHWIAGAYTTSYNTLGGRRSGHVALGRNYLVFWTNNITDYYSIVVINDDLIFIKPLF